MNKSGPTQSTVMAGPARNALCGFGARAYASAIHGYCPREAPRTRSSDGYSSPERNGAQRKRGATVLQTALQARRGGRKSDRRSGLKGSRGANQARMHVGALIRMTTDAASVSGNPA